VVSRETNSITLHITQLLCIYNGRYRCTTYNLADIVTKLYNLLPAKNLKPVLNSCHHLSYYKNDQLLQLLKTRLFWHHL